MNVALLNLMLLPSLLTAGLFYKKVVETNTLNGELFDCFDVISLQTVKLLDIDTVIDANYF